MPRQNRVTPYGELIAVPDRGMLWGNRGPLQWRPGRLTERYFLDEATGLAAGHRPCGECRYRAPLTDRPSGTVVDIGGEPRLVRDGRLLAWTPGGYQERPAEVPGGPVTVITPRVTVAVLAAGYQPVIHPSAGPGRR